MTNSTATDVPSDLGREIGGQGRAYFDSVVTDNVVDSLMEIAALLWTVRDRQIVLEKILAKQGNDVARLIEAHEPDDAEMEARRVERDAMVQQVFRSFLRRPESSDAVDPNAPSYKEMEDMQ
jgi:hypothetical protein